MFGRHAASLGPRSSKRRLTELCVCQGHGLLVAGAVGWVHWRTDGLAQRFRCSPEPYRLTRLALACFQGCQALQTCCNALFVDIALEQQGQALLVQATR